MKTAMVFLFLTFFSSISFAQDQYLLLNQRAPMHTEGAATLKSGEIQWGINYTGQQKRYRTTSTTYMYDPDYTITTVTDYKQFERSGGFYIDYGILDNLQAGFSMKEGFVYSGFDRSNLYLKYNVNPEEKELPLISFSIGYGGYWSTTPYSNMNLSLQASLSKTFGKFRTHLNVINYYKSDYTVSPGRKFDIGMAFDYNFSGPKLLLIGEVFVNNLPEARYEYRLGAKKQIGDDFLIYLGGGSSVGADFHPAYNFNVGINWYGFGFLKDL